jgi:hypothetical protein
MRFLKAWRWNCDDSIGHSCPTLKFLFTARYRHKHDQYDQYGQHDPLHQAAGLKCSGSSRSVTGPKWVNFGVGDSVASHLRDAVIRIIPANGI